MAIAWRLCAVTAALTMIAVLTGCKRKPPIASPGPVPFDQRAPEQPAGGAPDRSTAAAIVPTTAPPGREETNAPSPGSFQSRLSQLVHDVYFDYDRNGLRPDARQTLESNARALDAILADFPRETIAIEGHCDERGSAEYNLGLGDRRAQSAVEFLGTLGLPPGRFRLVPLGKEKPQCTEESESCRQKNRRVHFAPTEP